MISNSKGFNSTPLVDVTGMPLDGTDPVIVAVGTFASQPESAALPPGLTLNGSQYAALLAEFTQFGPQGSLVQPVAPLNLMGVFEFQHDAPIGGTPLADKAIYVIVAKGTSLAAATEVCILRTNGIFDAAEDGNALPKRVSVGNDYGTTVIAGSSSVHLAAASNLDPTLEPAYSLAEIANAPEIAVEQPEGGELADGTATVDFDFVTVGYSADLTFTIRNSGGSDLHLTGEPTVAIGGPDAARFTVSAPPDATVAPGGHTTFTVRFSPIPGPQAVASLSIANDDPDENPFDIQLTGSGAWAEIVVESPSGTDLTSGAATLSFGPVRIGGSAVPQTVEVVNLGAATLTGLEVTLDGADFTFDTTALPEALPLGGRGSIGVNFNPAGENSGTRSATLRIASSDYDENPFVIALAGVAYSPSADSDGDGMSDWAEYRLAGVGFDWTMNQTAMVNALYDGANDAGLFTQTQVQALHVGTPLIYRNPGTGKFKLTMDWKKSTNLADFFDFPAPANSVSVNPQGDIEMEFTSPDDAAFFRLEAR